MIKKIFPYQFKITLQLIRIGIRDLMKGYTFNYAKSENSIESYPNEIEIRQELKPNEAKVQNLWLAIKKIEAIEIKPNEIFSFWRVVGNPSKKKGFAESRSLVEGKLKKSFGGGLCQLSGLIYFACLHAKLEIIERHNHSVDIYTDETRFAPLGSDATVAYGYKDLKIKNNLTKPIKFDFSVEDKFITIKLKSVDLIERSIVEFKKNKIDDSFFEITTLINKQIKDKSMYRMLMP